jgi:gas vesicle protein
MDSKRLTRVLRALLAGDLDFGASRRRRSSRAAFFLAGVGTGVLVGMLVTPASGKKLRGDIGARAREGFDKVRSKTPGFAGRQKTPSGETSLAATAEKNVS